MFKKRPDIIRDIKIENGKLPFHIKILPFALGGFLTAQAIQQYYNDGDKERFTSSMHANEMFCRKPGFDLNFLEDPYLFLKNYQPFNAEETDITVKSDHDTGHKIVTISFDYNETNIVSDAKKEHLKKVLADVINNPDVSFTIAGHATYDLDEKYALGQMPKGFDEEHKNHLRNNFEIAAQRIDKTKKLLSEIGIDEHRIIKEINHGVRYDKRAVDLEICDPHAE